MIPTKIKYIIKINLTQSYTGYEHSLAWGPLSSFVVKQLMRSWSKPTSKMWNVVKSACWKELCWNIPKTFWKNFCLVLHIQPLTTFNSAETVLQFGYTAWGNIIMASYTTLFFFFYLPIKSNFINQIYYANFWYSMLKLHFQWYQKVLTINIQPYPLKTDFISLTFRKRGFTRLSHLHIKAVWCSRVMGRESLSGMQKKKTKERIITVHIRSECGQPACS